MNEEKDLMKLYGITKTMKPVYGYKKYIYENFSDALEQAKLDRKRLDKKSFNQSNSDRGEF